MDESLIIVLITLLGGGYILITKKQKNFGLGNPKNIFGKQN